MNATPIVERPEPPMPEPSGADLMAWLGRISRGLDWGDLLLEPHESEVAPTR